MTFLFGNLCGRSQELGKNNIRKANMVTKNLGKTQNVKIVAASFSSRIWKTFFSLITFFCVCGPKMCLKLHLN